MGLSEDIGNLLVAASVCSTSASATSTGYRLVYRDWQPSPPMPVRQVCVTQTGGFQTEYRSPISRPTFQIRVKGTTGEGAALETQVQSVIDAVNFQSGTINGWTYVDIQMQGDRLYLGRDEHQQPAYSVNFLATRSRTS